jgi:transcriptional regulator with XRE-family HTH domain
MVSRWEKGISLPSSLNIFKLAVLYRTMADTMFPNLTQILKEKILKREEEILKIADAKSS